MATLKNLARETTATTGTAGTVTLGGAATGLLTWEQAGALNAVEYSYGIWDGTAAEVGRGVYGTAGTTVTRGTILDSTAGYGTAINLSGTAEVFITALAEDLEINQTSGIVHVELYNETLAGTANFDVSSISQDYDHLLINILVRSSNAAATDSVYLFFNNDTTVTNYFYQKMSFYDGTGNDSTEGDTPLIAELASAGAPANSFGVAQILISKYAGSHNKSAISEYGFRAIAGQARPGVSYVEWESTAAINRITIQPDGYATDSFVTGSWCQVIGVKTVT